MYRIAAVLLLSLSMPFSAMAIPSFSGLGMVIEDPPPPGLPETPAGETWPRWWAWTPDGQYATGATLQVVETGYQSFYVTRWAASGGIEVLAGSPGGQTFGTGISDDGRVIAFQDSLNLGMGRWEEGVGMQFIRDLDRRYESTNAAGISGDGSVIFGNLNEGPYQVAPDGHYIIPWQALIWDASGKVTALGDLEGGYFGSHARGASFDGSVVFGIGTTESGFEGRTWNYEAFIWDESHGMRELDMVLAASGLDFAGWSLGDIREVSNDGLTIIGTGMNPNGYAESWVAVIPEPSTSLLVGLGLIALGVRRHTGETEAGRTNKPRSRVHAR